MTNKKLPKPNANDPPLTPGDPDRPRDPYAEGADAALAGVSDTKNPYENGSDDEASWNDGYMSISEAD